MGKPVELVNVYYPEGSSKEHQVAWLSNLDHEQVSWVIAGDFNVSHQSWDSSTPSGMHGEHLSETILNSNLVLLNHLGSYTRIGTGKQRNSAIDLTFISSGMAVDCEWSVGFDSLQSDHLPIHIDINDCDTTDAEVDDTPKYQFSNANWSLFQSSLERSFSDFQFTSSEPEAMLEEFRDKVLTAADLAIPKKNVGACGIHRHTSSWWSDACSEATSIKRKALRT